jgi:hypothetical protein
VSDHTWPLWSISFRFRVTASRSYRNWPFSTVFIITFEPGHITPSDLHYHLSLTPAQLINYKRLAAARPEVGHWPKTVSGHRPHRRWRSLARTKRPTVLLPKCKKPHSNRPSEWPERPLFILQLRQRSKMQSPIREMRARLCSRSATASCR